MKLILATGLFFSNTALFAADLSGLSTHIASYNQDGSFSVSKNVFMVVVDPLGRETGYNPFTNTWKRDIPYSGSGSDTIDDAETGDPGPADFGVHVTESVMSGKYDFKVYGLRNVQYILEINIDNSAGSGTAFELNDYISSGTISLYSLQYDPAPGAPAPVIIKTITFDNLRGDVTVARQLNQLGDDNFAKSLIRNIDLAEKLSGVCNKRKAKKDKCEPAIAVLKMFIKRLEHANRKCGNPADCDEEREWAAFRKEHGRDDDYKDFFRDWDRDDWHKHKKQCKRFITDEALKIISEDAGWLIKSLGGTVGDERGNPGRGKHD